MPKNEPAASVLAAAERLSRRLKRLIPKLRGERAPHVLDPLQYAGDNHRRYIELHVRRAVLDAVLFGMNPGPWGMGQTGVPFGDPGLVRDFLGIDGAVEQPRGAHERVPIRGVASPRSEVSGQRLWGGARDCFGTADAFFDRFFVANYCPLLFLSERGSNVTPDKLPKDAMAAVLSACDDHAREVIAALRPARVLGIGKWAEKRLVTLLQEVDDAPPVGTILHPSPASPIANRGWLPAARRQLEELGCAWPSPATGSA